jgi:hypothetical protein
MSFGVLGWVALALAPQVDLPSDLAACLRAASRANTTHELESEQRLLAHAESLGGDPEDEAEVQCRLAVIDWKLFERFDTARARLRRAAESSTQVELRMELARMEYKAERFADAHAAAAAALAVAETEKTQRRARVFGAVARVGAAMLERRAGGVASSDELTRACDELAEDVRAHPGYLDPARKLLHGAVLLDRGPLALVAAQSYYHSESTGWPNAIAVAGRELERLLPVWRGAAATRSERIELVHALSGTRFFDAAELVALDPRAPAGLGEHELVRGVVAYARYLRELRDVAEAYYRRCSLGTEDAGDFRRDFEHATAAVVAVIEGRDRPRSYRKSMLEDLAARYGTLAARGETAGTYDLHMGHAVVDRTRVVEQYGYRADVRFVAIDTIVSNGYQSWAWENGASDGGWGGADEIVQVRPAYATTPIAIWDQLTLPASRSDWVEETERETALDEGRAAADPYAYLPGLARRLHDQARAAMLAELRADGLAGDGLREGFVAEYGAAVQDYSIFAHEGRHAIDAGGAARKNRTRNSEYTAKLSQIAFARHPRLAVTGCLWENVGDDTPHGQANLLVTKGLVAWMDEHQAEIDELDPTRPLLPQLDLLTDDQLRAAARSLDPLAK